MNLIDPDVLHELRDLINQFQAANELKVVVFDSANTDFYIAHVDILRESETVMREVGPTGLNSTRLHTTFVPSAYHHYHHYHLHPRKAAKLRVRQGEPPFIFLEPPDHDRLRRVIMHQFTPERIEGMRDHVIQVAMELLNAQRNRGQLDIGSHGLEMGSYASILYSRFDASGDVAQL